MPDCEGWQAQLCGASSKAVRCCPQSLLLLFAPCAQTTDKKVNEALGIADAEKRKVVMKDIEQILQDSGIIIQPYWRKLYNHHVAAVMNHGMHPTFEHDYGKVWLNA